ncbi:acyltransferase [Parafrankia sp. FMc2]|uniref:acyltransferase n=1 Tax=Parafrankia sp. FMc2 TaxID=3233196 RepID=UPI0034D3C954
MTLEDGVFCGPSVVFTNVLTPRATIDRRGAFNSTLIRENTALGANSTIVCGITVGRSAFVGAGAVLTRDVPDHGLVLGVPAGVVSWVRLRSSAGSSGGRALCRRVPGLRIPVRATGRRPHPRTARPADGNGHRLASAPGE